MTSNLPTLPHSVEAERSILGAVLLDPKALPVAAEKLNSNDFFLTQNQILFREMLAMHQENIPVDLVTLSDRLGSKGLLERAGGLAYISSLSDGVPRTTNVAHYAAIVADKSRLRITAKLADRLRERVLSGELTAAELPAELDRLTHAVPLNGNGNGNGNGHGELGYPLLQFLNKEFPEPDHLVDGVMPRGGSILIVAMPHHLKSFFTTGLALAATREGVALGRLAVKRPVRTILIQVEDSPGEVKKRIKNFLASAQFDNCDPRNLWIIERTQFDGFTDAWINRLLKQVKEFQADLVILDVLRRFFVGHGDINSPQDTQTFLEKIDLIRDAGCAVALVHHENRKDADIMGASAGSYNFPGWAQVLIRFKRKMEEKGIAKVEIEVDNKVASSPEPMRMVLDFGSSHMPLRLEGLEESDAEFKDAMDAMADKWTVNDLKEHLGVHRTNAWRRVKAWIAAGKVRKVSGHRGRGGMAQYERCDSSEEYPPVPIRRVQ